MPQEDMMSQLLTPKIAATHASAVSFAHFTFDKWTHRVESVHTFKAGPKAVASWRVMNLQRFVEWAEDEGTPLVDTFSGPQEGV